eukprot:GILJ01028071.1.p1 GENE.GILJ01028071.1~~GILJ01028071.1.p1  ORF type:complete len:343 (-),score=18.80 GILJ01028071.1:545-1573(-)
MTSHIASPVTLVSHLGWSSSSEATSQLQPLIILWEDATMASVIALSTTTAGGADNLLHAYRATLASKYLGGYDDLLFLECEHPLPDETERGLMSFVDLSRFWTVPVSRVSLSPKQNQAINCTHNSLQYHSFKRLLNYIVALLPAERPFLTTFTNYQQMRCLRPGCVVKLSKTDYGLVFDVVGNAVTCAMFATTPSTDDVTWTLVNKDRPTASSSDVFMMTSECCQHQLPRYICPSRLVTYDWNEYANVTTLPKCSLVDLNEVNRFRQYVASVVFTQGFDGTWLKPFDFSPKIQVGEFTVSFTTDEYWEKVINGEDDSEYRIPVLVAVSSEEDWKRAWCKSVL